MTETAEAIESGVVDHVVSPKSPAIALIAEIIGRDPVNTPETVHPRTIGLREKWDLSAKDKDFVTLVDGNDRPALFIRPQDFTKFVAGKDVADVARGVGDSPQAAWSDLFTRLADPKGAILVVGKPGSERRYYTLEPFNEAVWQTRERHPSRCVYFALEQNSVRWAPWTPPVDMSHRHLSGPKF